MINNFIGIPFIEHGRLYSGCDCAGLVLLFYRDFLKINLEDFVDYVSTNDRTNSERIAVYFSGKGFSQAPIAQKRLGDVAVFSILNRPMHVGIVLEDNKYLHTREGSDSHIISPYNKYHNKVESIWRMSGK